MPARIIEELTSRKKEKIATFLTFESIVAVILAFMPIFMISGSWPLLTRVPLCAAAAVAGYVATLELHGMPLYEHVIWTARGLFRLRTQGSRVVPEDLPGAIPIPDEDRVVAASGPIELVQRSAVTAPRALLLASVTSWPDPDADESETLPTADDTVAIQAG
jgi:hypothetical protein